MSQLERRLPWSTGDPVDNTWHVAALAAGTKARYRLRNAIFAYPTCIRCPLLGGSRRNIAMPFSMEKNRIYRLPECEKKYDMFIRFDTTHERDRHTVRQTDIA